MVNHLPENNIEPRSADFVEGKNSNGLVKIARRYGRAVVMVLGTAAPASASALDIHGENVFDDEFGTNYSDLEGGIALSGFTPHNFTSNGVGFKGVNHSDSSTLYITTDGVTFTDVTSLLAGAESGMENTFSLCDYSGNFDQLQISSGDYIFIFEGIGNTGTVTNSFSLELLYGQSSCGSIDETSGEIYIIDGGVFGETLHAYRATESDEPTEHYDYNESDDMSDFHGSSIDDQGAFWNRDDDGQIYWIDGMSAGTGNATRTDFRGGIYGYFSNTETGTYPMIVYYNGDTHLVEYMYDLDSPGDLDADGYTLDEGDCDNSDASVYPGASENTNDGIDNDCDERADFPTIQSISVSEDFVSLGESIDLNASASDEETLDRDIVYTWTIEGPDGSIQDELNGNSASYTSNIEGEYTAYLTVTDSDGNESESSITWTARETSSLEELPNGDVEPGTYEDADGEGEITILTEGVTIEDGVLYLSEGAELEATNASFEYDSDAGVGGSSEEWDGAMCLCIRFFAPPDDTDLYPYADTDDTTKMLYVEQFEGTLIAQGTYSNNGELELNKEFTEPGEYYLADLVDDPENSDTGYLGDTSSNEAGNNPEEKTNCEGCANTTDFNGSWVIGTAALALAAGRRRKQK